MKNKTKTSELIEKMFKEELNQQIPSQSPQRQELPQQQNVQPQSPDQQPEGDNEEQQKIEVYIPLHDGRFTNTIFTTSKNVLIKILNDSVESDMDTIMELENNPSMYNRMTI